MDDDAERWDERYRSTPSVHSAPPEAVDRWPELDGLLPTSGRALDIACGPGSVTLWLAERGLDVTALDVSPVAIGLLHDAAAAHHLGDRVDGRVVDLDDGLPAETVDCSVIVCQRFRDPSLSSSIIDRLHVGGYAVVTVLSEVGTDRSGAFHAPPGVLIAEFGTDPRCDVVHDHEGDGLAHLVVRRR